MGFSDLVSAAGLTVLDTFLSNRDFILGDKASQADVTVFKAVETKPDSEKYANAAKWYAVVAKLDPETLEGDKEAAASTYGPDSAAEESEDDVDLFGSDDEEVDEEAEKLKQERLAEYAAKKAAKGAKPAAKSVVTLEVKPWDDETDLDELLENVKSVEMDGLLWGGFQWIPIGYGIQKLQINCVVEDDKISLDDLQQAIEDFEDHVQSTDIAAMQKL
ncbi:translation elongation factor 1 subunit beta [Nadsonia fulvescens var. elongata DSM 6958]|uniref:Translation elongation factor 1 subunit beta n=1 Tax=Nadsonia fulvescens var. elongata DSM 6958 TaxID=857566 RepID=A0A1E3PHR4_9ASCO|nr:translation elongation factor 1 subunit beta [Nadsonia fulvescens var. elongata DSM 6958]